MNLSNYKILIVDDDPEVLWTTGKIIESLGYEYKTVSSGKEALKILREEKYDLLLLDINMPDVNGIDVMKFINENKIKIITIIISAYENLEYAIQTTKLGAYDYLVKVIDEEKLKITIHNAFKTLDLEKEIESLKRKIEEKDYLEGEIITQYDGMIKILNNLKNIANYDISVLITGESGTGKELVAKFIHINSHRKDKPFISIDCATLPESLFESELFGYEKGSFTGATDSKIGRFELAEGGTLFLDEIGNLPMNVQKKLLRVLQEKKIMRIGGKKIIDLNVRIISATNVDLKEAIKKGEFREDLYHRLNEFTIELPPLRERIGDIPLLTKEFIKRYSEKFGKKIVDISDDAQTVLNSYHWSGNVRELENVIKQAIVLAEGHIIEKKHLPKSLFFNNSEKNSFLNNIEIMPLKDALQKYRNQVEKEIILKALNHYKWNKTKVAEVLQIDYKTLFNKMKEYGIE